MNPIRIILVEDSPDYQKAIALGLSDEPDIEVTRLFNTADAALRYLKDLPDKERPDLILLDLSLPGISGLEAIPQFKTTAPKIEIIVLTGSEKEADVLSAISSGAAGYLLKEASMDQITEGIRIVVSGGASLDPNMARYLLSNFKHVNLLDIKDSLLSSREMEILDLLAKGHLQKQIATILNISPKTVDFHIGHIYKKLQVQNAPAAVAKAYITGIFYAKN